ALEVGLDVGRHVLMWEEAGHEAVDLDPVRSPLDGERLREVLHARLRRRRMGEAGAARPRVGRADVHDRARRPGGEGPAAAHARAQRNVPLRVMSTTVRHAFGDMSSAGTGKLAAALLTSTPGSPTSASAASNAAATSSG